MTRLLGGVVALALTMPLAAFAGGDVDAGAAAEGGLLHRGNGIPYEIYTGQRQTGWDIWSPRPVAKW